MYVEDRPHLTSHKHASDFPNHGLVTAQISSPLKNEADVVSEVDSSVLFCFQTHGKPNHSVPLRCTDDQPATHVLGRNDKA